MPCDDRGRGWSDTAASQETPRLGSGHQQLGRGKDGSSPENQREQGPLAPLISDFWLPEPGEITFVMTSTSTIN